MTSVTSSGRLWLHQPAEGVQQSIISDPSLNENPKLQQKFRLNLCNLQQMHLRKLQVGLVKHTLSMYSTRNETQDWEKDLAAYG